MTDRHYRGASLLSVMAAAFPNAFFADPRQVQPLKVNIHRDIATVQPEGVTPFQMGRFLYWYVNRPAYQRALADGRGRIDLTGAVVDAVIPDAIREQARERWRTLQQQRAARRKEAAGLPAPKRQPRPQPPDTPPGPGSAPASPLNLEELCAMAVDAKLEVTLKFSTLPEAQPAGAGKIAFALRTPNGQFVVAEISVSDPPTPGWTA